MRGTAFLFAGQGSQRVGMDADVLAAGGEALLERADATLGFPLSAIMRHGPPELLERTAHAQPALLLVAVAQFRALAAARRVPAAVAGHSLGQYAALVAAGALELDTALRLVHARGQLMQETVSPGAGRMTAVVGIERAAVCAACHRADSYGVVQIACHNAPGHTVISGAARAVGAAEALLEEAGAGLLPLAVSVPFHCRLLEPMLPRWAALLADAPLRAPLLPVIDNVTARPLAGAAGVRTALLRHVTARVLFEESLAYLVRAGIGTFVQLGPGRGLLGFARRVAPDAALLTFDEVHATVTARA